MPSSLRTFASVPGLPAGLQNLPSWLVPVKPSALKEAVARGYGFRTDAARAAASKSEQDTSGMLSQSFDDDAFERRLAELSDERSATTARTVLEGARLDITVTKVSAARQRAATYSDVAYDVEVVLSGVASEVLGGDVVFRLPQFGRGAVAEPYRVDSAHDRRELADYQLRHHGGGNTLVAKLVNGHWHGGLFVYAPEHQRDDARCIESVRAALTRAILPELPTRVRCSVFKPSQYEDRAWRVEIRLPSGLVRRWGSSPFVFYIPTFRQWIFQAKPEYRYGGVESGVFVDGIWAADLYSNGVSEDENSNRRVEVWQGLLDNVNAVAEKLG